MGKVTPSPEKAKIEMPPNGCLKCSPQWNSIELCDNCEVNYLLESRP